MSKDVGLQNALVEAQAWLSDMTARVVELVELGAMHSVRALCEEAVESSLGGHTSVFS